MEHVDTGLDLLHLGNLFVLDQMVLEMVGVGLITQDSSVYE